MRLIASDKNVHMFPYYGVSGAIRSFIFFLRELDFLKRQEAERKKIEDLEKAHLVEVQGLQVRVSYVLETTKE